MKSLYVLSNLNCISNELIFMSKISALFKHYLYFQKVSEKWKDATFVKVIKDKLDCPLEIAKTENTASTSLDLNQSLASSNPIDLELPGGISILILTYNDYANGTSLYKRRLARFYRAKTSPGIKQLLGFSYLFDR